MLQNSSDQIKSPYLDFSKSYYSFLLVKFLKGCNHNEIAETIKSINIDGKRKNVGAYHIFGVNDLLCINKVDLLYSHISPYENELNSLLYTNTLAGFTFQIKEEEEFISKLNSENNTFYPFVALTQIKLNNSYIFGDSSRYLSKVTEKIKTILEEDSSIRYVLNFSFSSYELTLCQFGNSLASINENIKSIRTLNLEITKNDSILNYYNTISVEKYFDKFPHFISDTMTHYGIKITKTFNLDYSFINFNEELKQGHDKLFFVINFKIKPGHINELKDILELKENFIKFISGRSDVELNPIPASDFYAFFKKLSALNSDKRIEIVREMTTRLVFNNDYKEYTQFSLSQFKLLIFPSQLLKPIYDHFKNKHSYDTYLRVRKMFSSYNTAITNPLTFNLYIDFYEYLNHFTIHYIDYEIAEIDDIIRNYERAYYVRHFHEYNFDEGSELFLGYNLSMQGLISDLDTIFKMTAFCVLKLIYIIDGEQDGIKESFKQGEIEYNDHNFIHQITYITDTKPTATAFAANFNIASIFHPELFFNYLVKECIVSNCKMLIKQVDKKTPSIVYLTYLHQTFVTHQMKEELISAFPQHIKKHIQKLDIQYHYQDFMLFLLLFEGNFKHYIRLQLLSLAQAWKDFDSGSNFEEKRIPIESYRWMFIASAAQLSLNGAYHDHLSYMKDQVIKIFEKELAEKIVNCLDIILESMSIERFHEVFRENDVILESSNKIKNKLNSTDPDISNEYKILTILRNHIDYVMGNELIYKSEPKGGLIISIENIENYNGGVIKTMQELNDLINKFKSSKITSIPLI